MAQIRGKDIHYRYFKVSSEDHFPLYWGWLSYQKIMHNLCKKCDSRFQKS